MESCDDDRMDNCYICQSYTQYNCQWSDGKCSSSGSSRAITQWWETFDGCTDYLNLCRYVEFNSTFIEFNIQYDDNGLVDDLV